MAESLFTTQTPTGESFDATGITLGTKVRFSAVGNVTHILFYAHSVLSGGTYIGGLYELTAFDTGSFDPGNGTGTLLGQATFGALTANAWNTVALSSAIAVDTTKTYVAVVYTSVGRYKTFSNLFVSSALVNGNITGPRHNQGGASNVFNGVYNYAAGISYPNDHFSGEAYGVDVSFTATGGGTTEVSSDLDIRWRSATRVQSDFDARWRVATRVNADHDFRWRVAVLTASAHDFRWRVATRVTSDHDFRWITATRVTSDLDTRWLVVNVVSSDLDVRWVVQGTTSVVTSDLDVRWRSAEQVQSDLSVPWRVATRVQSDVDVRWNVRTVVTSDADIRWLVWTGVTSQLDIRWLVLTRVQSDHTFRWIVLSDVVLVPDVFVSLAVLTSTVSLKVPVTVVDLSTG